MDILYLNGKLKERITSMKKKSMLIIVLIITFAVSIFTFNKNHELVDKESLAVFIDDVKADSFPSKGTVTFLKADCDNNATIEWDKDSWGLFASNLTKKTKCNLYFKNLESINDKLNDLVKSDKTNIASDDPDGNIRYIGASPSNYVYFNCSDYDNQTSDTCEIWRIIGLFKNINKEDGTKEDLVKIIKDDSIGSVAWDTNNSNIWANASLKSSFNSGIYYNKTLKNDATRNMIESVVWKLGSTTSFIGDSDGNPSSLYSAERNSSNSNNWTGKIALMYPSDYGYAVGGSDRETCLSKSLYNWSSMPKCYNNNYLYKANIYQWTLMTNNLTGSYVYAVKSNGGFNYGNAYSTDDARPSLFLKSGIIINNGDGSRTNPYQLSF